MGKIKWASTKLLSFQHKDVKEFRSYMKFVYNDFLNHENIFHEYLLNPTRSPNQDQSLHSEEHSDHDTNNTSNPTLNHSHTTSKNEDKEFHPIASIGRFLDLSS